MVKNFSHQKSIGVVGSSPDAERFIQKANQLGFMTYQLVDSEDELKYCLAADRTFSGTLDDEHIVEEFMMKCDFLVYYNYSITPRQMEEVQKATVVPQGDDLLSIARDRALQKAFKESLSLNIAPYETIVKAEDIKQAIRSIGYPAVLRTNFIGLNNHNDSMFIYDENDIEKASELLKYGTCILESWIVAEHELSVTAVKTVAGHVEVYPIVKKNYRNERLEFLHYFMEVDQELIDEIRRVAVLIADNIPFRGALSIDFLVSPAKALYVGNIYPYPNILTRYSEGKGLYSVSEAHLRAIVSLPIPEMDPEEMKAILIPIYADQKEKIDELITIYPNWSFTFYPAAKDKNLNTNKTVGHIVIHTDNVAETLNKINNYN